MMHEKFCPEPPATTPPDTYLIQEIQGGNTDAFEQLYRRHNKELQRNARSLVGPNDAEDVAQETWLRAYERIGVLDQYASEEGRVVPWLVRVTRNIGRDVLKSHAWSKTDSVDLTEKTDALAVEKILDISCEPQDERTHQQLAARRILHLVGLALNEKEKELLLEAVLPEPDYTTYAANHNMTYRAAKERVVRLRSKLRKIVGAEYEAFLKPPTDAV
jgi:RNA polymerase sigma-70 factor (ECF subfamily)